MASLLKAAAHCTNIDGVLQKPLCMYESQKCAFVVLFVTIPGYSNPFLKSSITYKIQNDFEYTIGQCIINATCDKNPSHFYLLYNEIITKMQ